MYNSRQSCTGWLLCSGTILLIGGIIAGLSTITFYGIAFFVPGLILLFIKRMYIKGKSSKTPSSKARSEPEVISDKNQTKNFEARKKPWEQTRRQKSFTGDSYDEFFAEEKKKNQSQKSN